MKTTLIAAGACLALSLGFAHFHAGASSSVIDVSTVPQLQAAVDNLTSGQVVRIAAGRYALTQQLRIRNGVTNVALVGATGTRDDVVIVGSGMNTPGVNIAIKVENAQDVRIADLSVGEAFEHPIQLQGEQGAERVHVSNVRLFDAGQQFLKSTVDYAGTLNGVDNVIVENSLFEFTVIGPPDGYTQGIDAHHAANWIIRHNVFRNIRVPPGASHLNRPGVLMWGGSRNTTVSGNVFINCERGIIFGQGGQEHLGNSHSGGLIVNNFIYRTEPQHADAGISVWDSPGTRVYHNTVIQNGTYPAAIEYRFASTTDVEIINNLTDGLILQRDSASAFVTNNYTAATPSLFVDPARGDLHLLPTAAVAIDQGRLIGVTVDWDLDERPSGAAPDLGADERSGSDTTPPTVSITQPGPGATVSGTTTLAATAADEVGVVSVQFQVDGADVGTAVTTAPYSVNWNSATVSNGPHAVTAVARDAAGNMTTAAVVTVSVANGAPAPGEQSLLTTQVPDGEYRDGGGITYELGLTLRSAVAGQITALRYWKASLENGPHIGRVWTAGGELLASVTFTNESGVGWQQQALAMPIAVTAQTDYVVSVSTGANGYYVSGVAPSNTFANVVTHAHLQTSGPNGGRYGPLGTFPTHSSHGNYFRDVVFVPNAVPPDTTPPTVSVTQPGPGATVSGTTTLAATAADEVGVVSVQFQVDGADVGTAVTTAPYSVNWNSATVSNGPHAVTAVARDAAGNMTPSAVVTVTVANEAPAPGQQSLLTTQVPDGEYRDGGGITYELGVTLRSAVAGQITALRYWKASQDTGPHVGRVWSAAGQLLASVAFTNQSGVGWQQQVLATPVAVTAQVDYVVSVSTGANGWYVSAVSPPSSSLAGVLVNGHLQTSGPNGGRYGPLGSFPANSSHGNYFRDVLFVPTAGPPDTTPPTVSVTQPGPGATVSGTTTLAATAADEVGVVSVQFQVDGADVGTAVTAPYSVNWNSATVSNGPHVITAVARDAAGHATTSAVVTVTVANEAPAPGQQSLLTTQVPDGEYRDGGGITYELGVTLRSAVAGQITALRYWKASQDTGPHVGRVWSAAGQLLASVTFTTETAVGWQTQVLATPVAVTAQADYVVAVSTGANGWYVSAVSPPSSSLAGVIVNGHLQTSGPNGGRYGPLGSFPANSSHGNYFRDVVFVPTAVPPDTTPPTVSVTQPGPGATVSGTTTLAATAADEVGVVSVQFQVDGADVGTAVTTAPYSVNWNSATVSNGPHAITAVARDAAGNMTTSAVVTVTVANGAPAPGQQSLLTTQVPDGEYRDGGGITYELGVTLRSAVAGQITALRYWKASQDAGPHVGRVWSAAGQLLASVTFTNESAVGWQQQALATPVAVTAQADYVVSVSTGANGWYVSAVSPPSSSLAGVLVNGHLQTSGPNGGRYGPLGTFPANSSHGNYFRDVVFVPDGAAIQTQLTQIVSGLSSPLFVGHAGDGSGRLFIVERGGVIKVLQPGATTPTVFLNITGTVQAGGEQGLLGLAFHPLYESNGRFFVFYTRSGGEIVVAEYRVSANPNVADPVEEILLTIPHGANTNHNGGMLAFGPDNYLYIGVGDGGGANDVPNNAQNLNVLLGKILRIDIDVPEGQTYVSPPSNPFAGAINGRDEIFAYGMRNPWRFSFDRAVGDLWVADVGQGAREEVNSSILGGGNYGWRIWEGFRCTNNNPPLCGSQVGYVFPTFDYEHAGGRCSITGGYVYRGLQGAVASGTYVYGDYCSGEIFGWTGGPSQPVLLDTALNIASFGEDESGELYVVGLGGTISKLVPAPPPPPPPVQLDGSGLSGLVSRLSDTRHNSRAGHPAWLRCSSLKYTQYSRSSRLASRAPRSATYAAYH